MQITRLPHRVRYLTRRLELRKPVLKRGMRRRSPNMLVAFGGMGNRVGIPVFEFLSLTEDLKVKQLLVRDLDRTWYHGGVPGYGDSIAAFAESLQALRERHKAKRLVMIGNSSGAYAALMFGTLLGADMVLAFAPRTTLDLAARQAAGDREQDVRLATLMAEGALDTSWSDLSVALPAARHTDTAYHVYYDCTHSVDRFHAERLVGVPGVRFYRFGTGGHQLARSLRHSGALKRVLIRALE